MKHTIALILSFLLLLPAAVLADERADMVLSVAVNELGYEATKGGYSKYGEWGGKAYGEWCSEFVSWCVNEADAYYGVDLLDTVYPLQTSCETGAAWYMLEGRYVTTAGEVKNAGAQFYLDDGTPVSERAYIPRRGDLIYIEWYAYNRLDHVGIVEYVSQDAEGNYLVHTIEGNNHILGPEPTVVGRYTYRLDDPSIRGYGVLEDGLVGTEVKSGSSGEAVIRFQRQLKELGYYDGDCAGKFGKATQTAAEKYQKANNLPVTGRGDAATLTAMHKQLQAVRQKAEEKAVRAAQEKAKAQLDAAKEAIEAAWFGEFDPHDEEAVWERLMQPITVLNVDQKERVFLSDAPNGQRKTVDDHRGFFFGESAMVKVLEEQDGWTKIQAYNDYDELETGWVRPGRIKTVMPNAEYGMVVDKMAQRLYIYKEGKLLTTLLCSTGTALGSNEGYNETASGEFLLISPTGGFWSGNLWCAQGIRFNGGDLLHMVPAVHREGIGMGEPSGSGDYTFCERALGQKASHGCIRVQRQENEDGYNHQWIWNNLRYEKNIKIIVWDDDGRKLPETADAAPMYYNPDGGENYHTDAYCQAVRSAFLPMKEITYGALRRYPMTTLTPCGTCAAPQRPETVKAWNDTIDKAYEELGMTP